LIRLVARCAWVDVDASLDNQVSETTLRDRREFSGVMNVRWLPEEAVTAKATET
jgi:hypothetical protein